MPPRLLRDTSVKFCRGGTRFWFLRRNALFAANWARYASLIVSGITTKKLSSTQ